MNRAMDSRRIHTAPVTLASMEREAETFRSQAKAALLRELGGYEVRLQGARAPLLAKRRKARDRCEAATKAGKVDVGAAVASAFTEILTDGELGDVYFWRYVAKKLRIVAEARALDVARDAELAGLRRFMKSIK
jgi:hypothetical protein